VVDLVITHTCPYKGKIGYYLLLLVGVNTARLSAVQLNKGIII